MTITARRHLAAKIQPEHLPGPDRPWRPDTIGTTQLPVIPAIIPGNAIQRLALTNHMAPPIHRRVVEIVLMQRTGVTTTQGPGEKQYYAEEDPGFNGFKSPWGTPGTGQEPRGSGINSLK